MDCQHVLTLMNGYLDGELDLTTQLAIEQHLAGCPACHTISQQQRALRTALRAQARYHRASPELATGIQSALDEVDTGSGKKMRATPGWLSLAASVVLAALLGSGITYQLARTSTDELLSQEVIANHVRTQMVTGRLTDVSSSDSHTVKPWFSGKLNFSPPVLDLTAQGFPLVGGRLDYLAGRPVAALVYRHRQHVIQLYVWPTTDRSGSDLRSQTHQGFQLASWSDSAMHYWAISDLNVDALKSFSSVIQNQVAARGLPIREDFR